MESYPNIIERRAIDHLGRLGSLYDASRDLFVDNNISVQAIVSSTSCIDCDCRIRQGNPSNGVINVLKEIKFGDAFIQNFLLHIIQPANISSFIYYDQPINETTCFLYYAYKTKEEQLDVKAKQVKTTVLLSSEINNATHLVTKIIWGFEVLCVIPISDEQSYEMILGLLYNVASRLPDSTESFTLTEEEEHQLQKLCNITVFGSEKFVDNPKTSLIATLNRIREWQYNIDCHVPIVYTLYPLEDLDKNEQLPHIRYVSAEDNEYIRQIEPTIIDLDRYFCSLDRMYEKLHGISVNHTANALLDDVSKQLDKLSDTYEEFRTNLRNTLIGVRRGTHRPIDIPNLFNEQRYSSLTKSAMTIFYDSVQQSLIKCKLIERLHSSGITYASVQNSTVEDQNMDMSFEDIDNLVVEYFLNKYSWTILWYSSDRLKKEKPNEWNAIFHQLISEKEEQITIIYVDFQKHQQKLADFIIRQLPMQSPSESLQDYSEEPSPMPTIQEPPSTPSPILQRSPSPQSEINVLLLGETGVGKSTFINAFVNYLTFDTLEEAEQGEPAILIPVSFLTTVGHQFDEVMVKFGDTDPNENFENEGQSVTQQCKSYVFHLNDNLLLRFIDTPGMGDTRGLAQDDKNINHILTYVNNLSHINAVCLLIKPNTSRLNIFFRSCIQQLFTYLTPVSYPNIIFCFTNARSTFYAPGDTGPLLRKTLKQEGLADIPFEKQNVFCFDSESFRYLTAIRCNVEFDDFQKAECRNSWTVSVRESDRLLDYILKREPYYPNKWPSSRKTALEISMLARPLMETLRLIIYNYKLCEAELTEKEMTAKSVPVIIQLCSHCVQSEIAQVGSLWVVEYGPVKNNTVEGCDCPFDQNHFLIESAVKYALGSQPIQLSQDELKDQLDKMLFECDKLVHYLQQEGLVNENDDPFDTVLKRFLEEERDIADTKQDNDLNMNKTVTEMLLHVRQIRQTNKQHLIDSTETYTLEDIYQIIAKLGSIPVVKEQLENIKTSRRFKMQGTECQVELILNENQFFPQLTDSFA